VQSAEFKSWWEELERESGWLADPHAAAGRLKERMRETGRKQRRAFLDDLMPVLLQRHHAYGTAFFLLTAVTDRSSLETFAQHLLPLPERQSDDEEAYLADLIRVLAAADDDRLLPAAEAYLLEREIGPQWTTVPWALWPHRETLFALAWTRFLMETDPIAWRETLRPFLTEAASLRAVRRHLEQRSVKRWQMLCETLLGLADSVTWLSAEQRAELQRVLK
jgi:hypothetical protein